MNHGDIAQFQIDCSKKEQQIRFLQSLRQGRDDQLWAWTQNYVLGYKVYTEPEVYRERQAIGSGYTNWQINQQIMMIVRNC